MINTSEGATKLYPLRGWMLTPEKEHNLQLLHLLAFLHAAVNKIPKALAGKSATSAHSMMTHHDHHHHHPQGTRRCVFPPADTDSHLGAHDGDTRVKC
jgi:hypothetical protein